MIRPRRAPAGVIVFLLVILVGTLSGLVVSPPFPFSSSGPGDELFVSSWTNGTVTRIALDTLTQTVVLTGLASPEDGTCNAAGQIYFTELFAGRIKRFERDGSNLTTILDSAGALEPTGLAFSAAGDLFLATAQSKDGAVWQIPGGSPGAPPTPATAVFSAFGTGVGFNAGGDLLAADAIGSRVVRFSPPFSPSNVGTLFASGSSNWNGLVVSRGGDVYVSGGYDGTVKRFDASGNFLGNVISGLTNSEWLEFDSSDNLYVTDFTSQVDPSTIDRVIRISPTGVQTVIASLKGAFGLAICPSSNRPPTISSFSASTEIEGASVTFAASASDPDGDPLQFRWDFEGDGTWDTPSSSDPTATHTFGDDFNGSARVEVSDGELTVTASANVTVHNVNPVVTSLSVNPTATPGCGDDDGQDGDHDHHDGCGDDDDDDEGGRDDGDDGGDDDDGDYDGERGGMGDLGGDGDDDEGGDGDHDHHEGGRDGDDDDEDGCGCGVTFAFNATATDPGSDDLTFTWDFGDGSNVASGTYFNNGVGPDPYPSPDGTFPVTVTNRTTHTYATRGNFTVTMTVTDDDGGNTTVLFHVLVCLEDDEHGDHDGDHEHDDGCGGHDDGGGNHHDGCGGRERHRGDDGSRNHGSDHEDRHSRRRHP